MQNGFLREHVDSIRETLGYLKRFREKTFVVKIDYTLVNDPIFPALVKDLSLLQEAGIRILIIPGAKERIDEILATFGVSDKTVDGIRITSEEAVPFIKMAAFDAANRVMTMLSANGINAVIGNWVRARGIGVIEGTDFQSSGLVEKVRVDTLRKVLDDGLVPIFPCVGWNAVGKPYNISSNELAVVAAVHLESEKLFFLTSRDEYCAADYAVPEGIPVTPEGRLANFSLGDLAAFFEANPKGEPGFELLRYAHRACSEGVERVHILDGRKEGVILKEIFSNLGSGTMVYANRYGGLRPMTRQDIADVLRIMRPFVERGILLPRTEAQLEELRHDYVVFELDGSVHACAALHVYPEENTAEIAGIAVEESYVHLGVGPKLVDYLSDRARGRNLASVFALTTQTADWFQKLGFAETDVSSLPDKKRLSYNVKRRSRIFRKSLV